VNALDSGSAAGSERALAFSWLHMGLRSVALDTCPLGPFVAKKNCVTKLVPRIIPDNLPAASGQFAVFEAACR
jgi:hypothetical protein